MNTSENGIFSDAYWNMHRNSIFFSFVCLFFSAPGVTIGGKIPAIGIDRIGEQAVRFVLFSSLIAALYNLCIFLLEWREQALPLLRKRQLAFDDLLYSDSINLEKLYKSVLEADAKSSKAIDLISKFDHIDRSINVPNTHGLSYFYPDLLSTAPAKNELQRQINDLVMEFQQKKFSEISSQEIMGAQAKIEHMVLNIFNSMTSNLVDITEYHRSTLNAALREVSSQIGSDSTSIKESLDEIPFKSFKSWLIYKRYALRAAISLDFVRVYVLGLLLPLFIFSVALTHFIGRFFWHGFGSLIF